ncbi:unnamed protein product, partial [Adineta steineri]
EEVNKVLDEVLRGKLDQLPNVLPTLPNTIATAEVDSEEDEMEKRLQALRS